MSSWDKLLSEKKKLSSSRKSEEVEYPLFIRLLLFVLFLGISGYIFYMFVFDRSPQYYIMKGVSCFVS